MGLAQEFVLSDDRPALYVGHFQLEEDSSWSDDALGGECTDRAA